MAIPWGVAGTRPADRPGPARVQPARTSPGSRGIEWPAWRSPTSCAWPTSAPDSPAGRSSPACAASRASSGRRCRPSIPGRPCPQGTGPHRRGGARPGPGRAGAAGQGMGSLPAAGRPQRAPAPGRAGHGGPAGARRASSPGPTPWPSATSTGSRRARPRTPSCTCGAGTCTAPSPWTGPPWPRPRPHLVGVHDFSSFRHQECAARSPHQGHPPHPAWRADGAGPGPGLRGQPLPHAHGADHGRHPGGGGQGPAPGRGPAGDPGGPGPAAGRHHRPAPRPLPGGGVVPAPLGHRRALPLARGAPDEG